MYNRTPPRLVAALIALVLVGLGVLGSGPAAQATADPDPTPGTTPTSETPSPRELLTVREPVDTSVTSSSTGFTVSATPRCSADFKRCLTWVEVPGVGISHKGVSTTDGHLVQWPSGWAPGTEQRVIVHSYAQSVFGYWYYSTAQTPAGIAKRPYLERPLGASEAAHDEASRTSTIIGTSTPRAEIRRGGAVVATADGDGRWAEVVRGLPVGTTPLTYSQWVDGQYKDQFTVTVAFAAPVANGGLADGDNPITALLRGDTTDVPHVIRATADFSSVSGSVTVDAPADTVFGAGQDTVRGEFRVGDSGDWKPYPGLVLTAGTPSQDRKHLTFDWDTSGKSFRNGEQYRFTFVVDTPAAAAGGSSAMGFTLRGSTDKGSTRVNGTTPTELPEEDGLAAPTAIVQFDADVNKRAMVTGTGVTGATVTVRDPAGAVIGTATVADGRWSLQVAAPGAGRHEFSATQALAGETSAAVTATGDFGPAVAMTGPATFTDGQVVVTGQSSTGARVSIVTGGKTVDQFTVSNADGTFTRTLTGVGSGAIELTATAVSRGALTTTATLATTSPVLVESVVLQSHARGSTFEPGPQAFTGRATAGAVVRLNPFGFDPRYAAYTLTTNVDQFGEWSIRRGLADTRYREFAFAQTPQAGVTNEERTYDLKPARDLGAPADLTLDSFASGDFFTPGPQQFSGTATPGATVALNPFGFDPRYASFTMTTVADRSSGRWTIQRSLADTVYRHLGILEEPEATGHVNRIEDVVLAPTGWVGAPRSLTVTSHQDGGTFTPGPQVFRGQATPGALITIHPFGLGSAANTSSVRANAIGTYALPRSLTNQAYPAAIEQTAQTGVVNSVLLRLHPKAR